ncbi:MAG: DUF4349 domain-containing protein [Flavobacteriales bacterium]|nr:DUF4349 domain-containing protein [Flavobacteriales bacterium]
MNSKNLIIACAVASMLISCSTQESSMTKWSFEDQDNGAYQVEERTRKVITNAKMVMTVDDRDSAITELDGIARKYDGYLNEAGTYRTVIRVKSDQLSDALEDVSSLGKVVSRHIYSEEVTDQYEDLYIRLDNAEKSRKRYLELLNMANTVSQALLVEHELERLNRTIDLLKGKINRMSHLTAYATITINLKEEVKPGVLGYMGIAIYHSVKWLFVRG